MSELSLGPASQALGRYFCKDDKTPEKKNEKKVNRKAAERPKQFPIFSPKITEREKKGFGTHP